MLAQTSGDESTPGEDAPDDIPTLKNTDSLQSNELLQMEANLDDINSLERVIECLF